MGQNTHVVLERVKSLEISQIQLFVKEWEAWMESLSPEDLEDYILESARHTLLDDMSSQELLEVFEKQPDSVITSQHFMVLLFSMLTVWQARKLVELRRSLST